MKPKYPTSYAEWAKILDQFAEQSEPDEKLLSMMKSGRISWIEGVGDKLNDRLNSCFEKRINDLIQKFQREQCFSSGNLNEFVSTIANIRARFRPLRRLANVQAFPDELKTKWDTHLQTVAQKMQDQLMDQLKELSMRDNRLEMHLVELKRNPIFAPELAETDQYTAKPAVTSENGAGETHSPRKRKLIL